VRLNTEYASYVATTFYLSICEIIRNFSRGM